VKRAPLGALRRAGPEVLGVASLSDGRHAVTGEADGTVRLWDLDAGRELERLPPR
jgi:hypothetical protein